MKIVTNFGDHSEYQALVAAIEQFGKACFLAGENEKDTYVGSVFSFIHAGSARETRKVVFDTLDNYVHSQFASLGGGNDDV